MILLMFTRKDCKSVGIYKKQLNIYLAVDFLMEISSILIGSSNTTFRKIDENLYRFDKMYMYKGLTEG